MFLYHFAHRRFEEALAEARNVGAEHVVYGWIAIASAAAMPGRTAEAAAAVDAIVAIDPRYGERVVEDLQARHLEPGLLLAVADGLRLAGLAGRRRQPERRPPMGLFIPAARSADSRGIPIGCRM